MLLRKALASLTSLCIAVLVVEVAARVVGLDDRQPDRFRFHPDLGWTIDPGSDSAGIVNESGFRHRSVRPEKGAREGRVVVLGDSFAEGHGLSWFHTFPGILEVWLNESDHERDWQVINLGVSGWGSAQQLIALESIALDMDPDVVVWQVFPHNDLCNNSIELANTCSLLDYRRPYLVQSGGRLRTAWTRPVVAPLRRSVLARMAEDALTWGTGGLVGPDPDADWREYAKQRIDHMESNAERLGLSATPEVYSLAPEAAHPPVIARAWRESETIVDAALDLVGQSGIELVAVVIPYSETFDDEWMARKARRAGVGAGAAELRLEAGYPTSRWERMFTARGAAVVSVRDLIAADPDMLPEDFFYPSGHRHDRHLNRFGHVKVAQWTLSQLVLRDVVSSPAPSDAVSSFDLFARVAPPVVVTGLVDRVAGDGTPVLAAEAAESALVFRCTEPALVALHCATRSEAEIAAVEIVANGTRVSPDPHSSDASPARSWRFRTRAGRNDLRLVVNGEARPDRPEVQFTQIKVVAVAGGSDRDVDATP